MRPARQIGAYVRTALKADIFSKLGALIASRALNALRRKLDPDDTLKPIETLRGRGYRMVLPRNRG